VRPDAVLKITPGRKTGGKTYRRTRPSSHQHSGEITICYVFGALAPVKGCEAGDQLLYDGQEATNS
jgi:hypothetical protein